VNAIADFKDTLYVLGILVSLGATLYTWLTARSRGNEKGLSELGEKVDGINNRLTKVEGEMQHLPDKDSQHRLELNMAELLGDMKQMAEAQKATTRTVVRMEEYLLNQGKRK